MTTPLDKVLILLESIDNDPAKYVHKTASEELVGLRNKLIKLEEQVKKLTADLEDARLDAEYRDD